MASAGLRLKGALSVVDDFGPPLISSLGLTFLFDFLVRVFWVNFLCMVSLVLQVRAEIG